MEPVKILIVEDQSITANRIKRALERKGYSVTAIVGSGEKALIEMKKDRADLILMDINLNGKIEGINAAREIKKTYPVSIIYITKLADEEIFQKAKETFPKNYISKPFSDATIIHAIELAILHSENNISSGHEFDRPGLILSDRIFVQTKEGLFVKLLLADILYVQSEGSYSFLYFQNESSSEGNFYYFSQSSNNLVDRLQFPALIRVHKSFFVNIYRIECIKDAEIFIHGSAKSVPVSRDYRVELDQRFKYLKHNPRK